MAHTPGPWKVVGQRQALIENPEVELTVIKPDDCAIAIVLVERVQEDEALANAALVAAAPGLLAGHERAEQTLRNLAAQLEGDLRTIALNEAANLRREVARARGEGDA